MELVEGALGESADFRIATYGLGARDSNSLKPSPFNTSSDSLSDKDDALLALQKSLQVWLLLLPVMYRLMKGCTCRCSCTKPMYILEIHRTI